MSVTEYQVISVKDTDATGLTSRVTTLIAAGWQPTGPLGFANGQLHQALIKGTPVGSGGSGEDYVLPAAGVAIGGVKLAAAQVDTVAADLAALKVDFNALLAKLRTSGALHT